MDTPFINLTFVYLQKYMYTKNVVSIGIHVTYTKGNTISYSINVHNRLYLYLSNMLRVEHYMVPT